MTEQTHGASRIKTLRLALGPGASAMVQMAEAATGKGAGRLDHMSMAGFFYPYRPGFPVFAYPGRRSIPPAFGRRPSSSPSRRFAS